MKRKVVITGIGIMSPVGKNKTEFWESIRNGRSGVSLIQAFDTTAFDCKIAGEIKDFNPVTYIEDRKRARRMDKFTQFAMAAAKEAIADSGLDITKEDPDRVGVMIGSGVGGLQTMEDEVTVLVQKGPRRVSPFLIPKFIANMASGEVAIEYGAQGPNYAAVSACASSANAIGDSLRYIRYGDADVIITGGTEAPITKLGLAGFSNMGALCFRNDEPTKESRPFDKLRDGFVMAEGSAIVVIESLEHALKRNAKIYAEIAGYGATDDAHHITAPDPNATSAIRAMQRAIADAEISPDQIDYINAHGTSTPLNDKTETLAIKSVFGDRAYKIPVSSTKSMTGHLLGAAAAIELVASIFCMNNSFIHPTINYENPDPDCDLDYVPNIGREGKIDCILSNSLGFGGHNGVLIAKKFNG